MTVVAGSSRSVSHGCMTPPVPIESLSLARLPYRQRCVIVLRYHVGLDDAEIARMLGCTRSTIRSSARRALLRLRREVQR